jgi:alpha-D-ribose 1-methylphosphonate 5-triphosphate synthase subunit PhnH
MASLAQTLLDQDTAVWLDPLLAADAAVTRWLAFHTGAPVTVDPAEAAFALVCDPAHLPPLASFATGTADYPDRSTTVIVAVEEFTAEGPLFDGPGFDQPRRFAPLPMPAHLVGEIVANRALYPRGVDLLFVADGSLVGLPRSTRVTQE